MTANSFGSRATLKVADQQYEIYRLDAVDGSGSLPFSLKILLENLLRNEDGVNITADHVRALAQWDPSSEPGTEIQFTPARVILQDLTGVPAVVDLAAMREAMQALGGDPTQDQPAHPGRAGHRPLRGGGRVRQPGRVQPERGDRVRAQPRAVPVPALGSGRVQPVQGGPAGHRHRASGEHRVPGPGRDEPRRRRLPRHLRGHRFAHHHAERPGHPRLGRRRHRGGGRDARPADLDAHPAGGRVPAHRRAAERRHRHRPGAHHHRAAAQARRGRQVRRVLRRRRGRGPGGQPRDHRQHVTGVRLDLRDLPHRRSTRWTTSALTGRPRRSARPGRGVRQGAGALARPAGPARRRAGTPRSSASTCPPWSRRSPARSARRTGSRWPTPRRPSATPCRTTSTKSTLDNGLDGTFPASDPVAAGDGSRPDQARPGSPWRTAPRPRSTTAAW